MGTDIYQTQGPATTDNLLWLTDLARVRIIALATENWTDFL